MIRSDWHIHSKYSYDAALTLDAIAQAAKENGRYVECNSHFSRAVRATEKYRYQYAEFLRELFELGLPITYGSDCYNNYTDMRDNVWKYLSAAGFTDRDIIGLPDSVFWV